MKTTNLHNRFWALAFVMTLDGTLAYAQALQPPMGGREGVATLTARRLSGTVTIDGVLDDPGWAGVPVWSEFRQKEPNEGEVPTEATEVRITYDNDALYVGVRLFDSEPSLIARRQSRRDREADADSVGIYLDPRHDHLTGALFVVSAAGVQADAILYNDFEDDDTWDAVWASKVTIDERGWIAEVKIPLSQLRFSDSANSVWGINVQRSIFRKNEDVWLQMVPRVERGLVSRFAHLSGMGDIAPRAHLELLPYTAARVEAIPSEPGDPFNDGLRQFGSTGLDLKWGLTSNLTLDATFNPDFGQVEVDPAVINLTEFETSYEEKRSFFLEGNHLFANFGQIGSGTRPSSAELFYSRRIGRQPEGDADGDFVDYSAATTIVGAAKLTGKSASGWSYGLLDGVTSAENARVLEDAALSTTQVEPWSNYFVGRALKEGDRAGSGVIGTLVNRRLGTGPLRLEMPNTAVAAGYDGYLFLGDRRRWVISGYGVGSHVTGSADVISDLQRSSRRYFQRPDADYVELNPTATSLTGWSGAMVFQRQSGGLRPRASGWATSPGFEVNDAGFQSRADEMGASAGLDYYNYDINRFFRSRSLSLTKLWRWNFGREIQRDSWTVSSGVVFPSYWYVNGSYSLNLETLDDHLTRGGPLALAPRSHYASADFGSDGRHALWLGGGGSYGWNEAGNWYSSGYLSLRLNASERLRFTTGPYVYSSESVAQYYTTVPDPVAAHTFGRRYVFAGLEQFQVSMTTRADLSLTPTLSIQLYVSPFVGVGSYDGFQELAAPRTYSFLKYGEDVGTIESGAGGRSYTIDPDGTGPAESFEIYSSDFNSKSLSTKAVFRWEWKPGSTVYVAWTQSRYDGRFPGNFNASRDFGALFGAPADNVFLIKMSYWFTP